MVDFTQLLVKTPGSCIRFLHNAVATPMSSLNTTLFRLSIAPPLGAEPYSAEPRYLFRDCYSFARPSAL